MLNEYACIEDQNLLNIYVEETNFSINITLITTLNENYSSNGSANYC